MPSATIDTHVTEGRATHVREGRRATAVHGPYQPPLSFALRAMAHANSRRCRFHGAPWPMPKSAVVSVFVIPGTHRPPQGNRKTAALPHLNALSFSKANPKWRCFLFQKQILNPRGSRFRHMALYSNSPGNRCEVPHTINTAAGISRSARFLYTAIDR